MASDLERGAYAGKETYLYYNSGTYASPTWVEIPRAKNVQRNRGPNLAEIEFHGASETGNVPGYKKFSGSFEYVRRRGADAVFDALETAREAGDIVHLAHLNGEITDTDAKGWQAPVLLGETQGSSNGNDGVVDTFAFAKADAYDAGGNEVGVTPIAGS